jgi:hypothetical protein
MGALHKPPKATLKKKKDSTGGTYYTFIDRYEKRCILQPSSLATQAAIWIGVTETGPQMGMNANKIVDYGAMHLNQEQVKMLLPVLQKFVKTGEI